MGLDYGSEPIASAQRVARTSLVCGAKAPGPLAPSNAQVTAIFPDGTKQEPMKPAIEPVPVVLGAFRSAFAALRRLIAGSRW